MCDEVITNNGVKNHQKRCKTFAMTDASNTVQVLVACAMKGIRFSSINCLRWGGTKEMGNQMKVCVIYSIRFTRMNFLWLGNTKETVSQIKVCVMYSIQFTRMNCLWFDNTKEMVRQIKVCAMYDMRFTRMNCLRWDNRTEMVQYNKYHKYCKVQIQRLQRPNSNNANIDISAKGSAADKSCMGLKQWLPTTLSYALPIRSLAFLEPLPFCSSCRLWSTNHSYFLLKCMFNLITFSTLALATKNLANIISGKVPR